MIITAKKLMALYACKDQYCLFVRTFGADAEVAVTLVNCERAMEAGLELSWLSGRVLSEEAHGAYLKKEIAALVIYRKACTPLSDAYSLANGTAHSSHDARCDEAGRQYSSRLSTKCTWSEYSNMLRDSGHALLEALAVNEEKFKAGTAAFRAVFYKAVAKAFYETVTQMEKDQHD